MTMDQASYVRDGDVLLTPGGGRWTLNLAGGRPVRMPVHGAGWAVRVAQVQLQRQRGRQLR